MASAKQFTWPKGTCTGTCVWELQGTEWFAVNDTCSQNCSCADQFKVAASGPIKQVKIGSTTPGDGLPDPQMQILITRYPDAIVSRPSNTQVEVACVSAGSVIDLS
jgi:hypothetical protein